jgi:hypothetical protein
MRDASFAARSLLAGVFTVAAIAWVGIAAAAHTAGSGASAAKDPLRVVLHQSDLVTGAHGSSNRSPASGLRVFGVTGLKGASSGYSFPAGGSVKTPIGPLTKEWRLDADVFVSPDQAGARKLFQLGKRAGVGLFSDVPEARYIVTVKLPSYGDEQLAYVTTNKARGIQGVVFVRKGTVVWELMIAPSPLQWHAARAQVLTTLKAYARKQKAHVGAG